MVLVCDMESSLGREGSFYTPDGHFMSNILRKLPAAECDIQWSPRSYLLVKDEGRINNYYLYFRIRKSECLAN